MTQQLKVEIPHEELEAFIEKEGFNKWLRSVGLDPDRKITWTDDHKSNVRIFAQDKVSSRSKKEPPPDTGRYKRTPRRRN